MNILNLGHIDYRDALSIQEMLVKKVKDNNEEETIIFCSHPSVVTLGKKSTSHDIVGWQGDIYNVSRGGKATYHGPGQLVIYPILDISKRNRDIYALLRNLELSAIQTLDYFGITAIGDPNSTGVWVSHQKIASIGLAVKRWISYHGMAINLERDPLAFQGINPCGFTTQTMISLEELLNRKVDRSLFVEIISQKLLVNLSQYKEIVPACEA